MLKATRVLTIAALLVTAALPVRAADGDKITSPSGVTYVAPGSAIEKARSLSFWGQQTPTKCPDGQPKRFEYSLPGGYSCAADRPQ